MNIVRFERVKIGKLSSVVIYWKKKIGPHMHELTDIEGTT